MSEPYVVVVGFPAPIQGIGLRRLCLTLKGQGFKVTSVDAPSDVKNLEQKPDVIVALADATMDVQLRKWVPSSIRIVYAQQYGDNPPVPAIFEKNSVVKGKFDITDLAQRIRTLYAI